MWLLSYMEVLAAEAGATRPEALAEELLILHEGACIANSMRSVDEPAVRAREVGRGADRACRGAMTAE